MIRRFLSISGCLALIVLSSTLMAGSPAHADEPQPLRIVLETTDVGYACVEGCDAVEFSESPWNPAIEVNQGQLVELTFVWGHQAYPYEEHIMVLEGYSLEWDQIDYDNREATLRFVADEPGAFAFKCDLKCDLHDYMQRGYVRVRDGPGQGAPVARTPTSLTLAASPSAWLAAGDSVTLQIALKDTEGLAVPRAHVRVWLDAEFAGIRDEMEIGRVRTDAEGMASLQYRPTLAMEQQHVTAHFEGMGIYAESQEVIELQVFGAPPPAQSIAPIGLEGLGSGLSLAFIATVLGVWGVFGFVVYQMYGIAREQE